MTDNSFDGEHCILINKARIEWIEETMKRHQLKFKDARILETGVGARGDITTFLEDQGALLTLIEARQVNIDEHIRRYPHREIQCIDMETEKYLKDFDKFDFTVCCGTLYHIGTPGNTLRELCEKSRVLFLTTIISEGPGWNFMKESQNIHNSSYSGHACRPNRDFLRAYLRQFYENIEEIQPKHPEFVKERAAFYCY